MKQQHLVSLKTRQAFALLVFMCTLSHGPEGSASCLLLWFKCSSTICLHSSVALLFCALLFQNGEHLKTQIRSWKNIHIHISHCHLFLNIHSRYLLGLRCLHWHSAVRTTELGCIYWAAQAKSDLRSYD